MTTIVKRIENKRFQFLQIEDRSEMPNQPAERRFAAIYKAGDWWRTLAVGATVNECEAAVAVEVARVNALRLANS